MTNYETLVETATALGLTVEEEDLRAFNGLIYKERILIDKKLGRIQKTCVLAEEISHFLNSSGNILDQKNEKNIKQELLARYKSIEILLCIEDIYNAKVNGCRNKFEVAEYLEVTEEFLEMALNIYRSIHGLMYLKGEYKLFLDTLDIKKCS